ncbi:MAG: CtsR family transcriptional regulator [Syntrophomonadaceae bacterium]|nr:CtsR family transcriptional regulator [Syntrophomonadaceae bacterium]MDD3897404.1 CtsR family transcriptional regulator [Syntrophomonadaceae bacterium]MDD4561600.1 CtsR family transcriptional regulator [Syntrophomonadaceae bacterium]
MKRSLADRIEQYLKVLIERSEDKRIEIQRSELAETFCCVPSQVTYVIGTRFTEAEGYFTESRRGGKGYVRISRYYLENGVSAGHKELLAFIDELLQEDALSADESDLLKHLISYAFQDMPPEDRRRLFKQLRNVLVDYVNLD